MKFFSGLFEHKSDLGKVVLIVQCRLSSTRLPRKALLDLGGKSVLEWTLRAMKKVKADEYYLATDESSETELSPVAKKCGFKVFAGPLEDVLERFCLVIDKTKADTVIRATADNPFLFYEAANALLDAYKEKIKNEPCDYITWTGLPHGSGIEIFNAHSLLKAHDSDFLTPYDHEHVGPALYKHPDQFISVMTAAPEAWNYPSLRTTIDTKADYRRALALVHAISGENTREEPYTTEEILEGVKSPMVANPILFVPSVKKGHGTGHLRRCIDFAKEIGADIYISDDIKDFSEATQIIEAALQNGLKPWQIVKELPEKDEYSLIVADMFEMDEESAKAFRELAPLAAIDEGASERVTAYCDYLLDIIPSYQVTRTANLTEAGFVPLPKNRKDKKAEKISKVLVSIGGEDPAGFTLPVAMAFAEAACEVTAIMPQNKLDTSATYEKENLHFVPPVKNLKEELASYDLIVTHYGFTAFEALAAGCAVVLVATSPLHEVLAENYGFVCLKKNVNADTVKHILEDTKALYPNSPLGEDGKEKNGAAFISELAKGHRFHCPVCQKQSDDVDGIEARTAKRTFRRCSSCGMIYISWTMAAENTAYNKSYFYEDYKAQYGKTYLEDFASIKAQGVRRITNIEMLYRSEKKKVTPTILDIGCAMGPFIDAAADSGWQVYGTDVSCQAVDYVQQELHYPAVCSAFPDFNPVSSFGVQDFDVVTMWYVIEHFQNLGAVLEAVSKIVKKDGIFAFSTPSASGVSARFNRQSFFEQSPEDHYTLWEIENAQKILSRYGFKVLKIVSTGHHPERFPYAKEHGLKPSSLQFKSLKMFSKIKNLGDTFEVYCKKVSDMPIK